MIVQRAEYFVPYRAQKANGKFPTQEDMIYLGYMAGRYGVNLNGSPYISYPPKGCANGAIFNINACTADTFEKNLSTMGMNFNRIG